MTSLQRDVINGCRARRTPDRARKELNGTEQRKLVNQQCLVSGATSHSLYVVSAMARSCGMVFVVFVCVCMLTLTTSMAAEAVNIQPLRDAFGGRDSRPDGNGSASTDTLARLLRATNILSKIIFGPKGPVQLALRYSGVLFDFAPQLGSNKGAENVDKHEGYKQEVDEQEVDKHDVDKQEVGTHEAEQREVSKHDEIDQREGDKHEDELRNNEDEDEDEDEEDKSANNMNATDGVFANSDSWYSKYLIQLVLVVSSVCASRSICLYAVKYIHAHQARYMARAYDVQDGRFHRPHATTLDLLLYSNRIGRFICYDSDSAAWGEMARRLSPRALMLNGSHDSMDGLNLIPDIERDDKDDEVVVEDIGQTRESLCGTRDHEGENVDLKEETEKRDKTSRETTHEEAVKVGEQPEVSSCLSEVGHARSAEDDDSGTSRMFLFRVDQNDVPSMSGSSQVCNADALRATLGRIRRHKGHAQ